MGYKEIRSLRRKVALITRNESLDRRITLGLSASVPELLIMYAFRLACSMEREEESSCFLNVNKEEESKIEALC